MALPDLVLVPGGEHTGACWEPTVAELKRQAPELRVLAVDLPGHGNKPGDLETVTVTDWVDSVVADIDDAGLGDVVVVGHSMAGLTVPGVVTKVGAPRVREMILAAAFIPDQGMALVDSLRGPLAVVARRAAVAKFATFPAVAARFMFCNGMTREQRRFTTSCLCPESSNVLTEPIDRSGLPEDVPRTWILTTRDRALSVNSQCVSIKALGGVDTIVAIEACHDVMISHPQRLAAILIERCTLGARG
ncbi:MAG: putative hydrolase, alpha/beta fold family protein [Mycobacterium sp.]|jgi:pimeloyl-ACP methyl ester carboxylesterase|nr:putative hydrolase, alpha/beta fold family protein [Mycobacterium sp.]